MSDQYGLYGFEGGTALICRCGHTLAVHRSAMLRPCALDVHLGEVCPCNGFVRIQAPKYPTLRSVSAGAVYDDGHRGKMRMEVTMVHGEYAAVEYLDWPERRQAREVGRTPTYEGAVELMWRHVVAASSRRD